MLLRKKLKSLGAPVRIQDLGVNQLFSDISVFNILQHLQYTVLHVRARSAVVSLDNSIKDFQAVYLYIEPDI